MMKIIWMIMIALIVGATSQSQEVLTGKLDTWNNGESQVLMMAGPGEPIPIGSVDAEGEFRIPLVDTLDEYAIKTMESQNQQSTGFKVELTPLKRYFSCNADGHVSVENGEQSALSLISMGGIMLGNPQEKKNHGSFLAASSSEFARALLSYGQKNAKTGYYLNWYHLEQPARVDGKCTTKNYALNQEESYDKTLIYDLDLNEGWNLVKVSIDDTFTDREGKVYPLKISYTTLDEIPEETTFVYFEE